MMSEQTIPRAARNLDAKYDAEIEEILAEVRHIKELIQQDQIEIDHIKSETEAIKIETDQIRAEGRLLRDSGFAIQADIDASLARLRGAA